MDGQGLMIRVRFIVSFLVSSVILSYAQPAKIIFDHYGPEDGLHTRTTRSVVKTRDGFVWMTTDDGLVRYDSERFFFYQHHQEDSTSIADNSCDQMVIDRDDRLWIVTGSGLDYFNPQTGRFSHCYILEDKQKVLSFNPESLYFDDQRDRVWVGTARGLFYVTIGSTELIRAKVSLESRQWEKTTFLSIVRDQGGSLWQGCNLGFVRYEPESGTYKGQTIPGSNPDKNDGGVLSLYVDDHNVLWIGTWVNGLVRYDITSGEMEQYFYADPGQMANGIVFITETGLPQHEDILWLSAVNFGFTAFHKKTKHFRSYLTALENDKQGIIGQTNRMLSTQTEGLWIASENGLHRYDFDDQVFGEVDLKRFNALFDKSFALEYLTFDQSTPGKDSLCWFHVPYLGAFIYDFYADTMYSPPVKLAPYLKGAVFGLYIDASNILWISTGPYGLVAYDLNHEALVHVPDNDFNKDWNWIRHFYEDAHHRLWLGTYQGLFMLDSTRQHIHDIQPVNSRLSSLGLSQQINGLSEDNNGHLWFTTSNTKSKNYAFGKVDPETNQTEIFAYQHATVTGLVDRVSLYNIECLDHDVFIGSDHGVITFALEERPIRVRFLSEAEGLINDFIPYLALTIDQQLWCSTVFGVSSYSPGKKNFMNYTSTSSGLGRTKHPAVYASLNTGRIYICQQGGMNVALSGTSFPDSVVPEVIFTSLKVSNKEYHQAGFLFESHSIIPLKYHQNAITVDFAMPSYRNAEANRYAYRLVGLDEDWLMTDQPNVTYANLTPGTYNLEVKAATYGGLWTLQPAVMTFSIAPPFYQTWWFRVSVAAIIFSIVYFIIGLKFRSLREQYALRARLAGDLHDEIGSTLTSIHILSKVSQQALASSPDQAREMLDRITSQSKAVQQSMSDIVWAIRPDNDKIENLVVRLREYAVQTLEPLNIHTQISVDEDLINQTMSLAARKELLLIFKEAIHNIVKHSGATLVRADLQKAGSEMRLIIFDNGTWKDNSTSAGTGMHSIRQRSHILGGKVTWSTEPDGTQVTLVFPVS